ncbi:MAG: methyltransferase domain-containing protein [Candidatus Aminicenantes bacterium]|nr:methyltransferase domain-containing protein [Candidatus Aminicenantes bacterium]
MASKGLQPTAHLKPVVLVVSSDSRKREELKGSLRQEYTVQTADSGVEAIQLLKKVSRVDAIVVDHSLPHMDGGVFIRYINEKVSRPNDTIKVLIGESSDKEVSYIGMHGGQLDYFYNRSFDAEEVKRKLCFLMSQKSKEKRKCMRVDVTQKENIRTRINLHSTAPVKNISENGMFVEAVLPEDRIMPFTLYLSDGTQQEIAGHVVHIDEENQGAGIRFLNMDEKSREILARQVMECATMGDLSQLKNRYPFLQVDSIIPFKDKGKIKSLLCKVRDSNAEITAIPSHSRLPSTLKLTDIDPWYYCRLSGENLDTKFKTSESIFVSFQSGYATYNFETVIYRISDEGTRMDVLYPQILFYSEKRAVNREKPKGHLEVEIILPPPFDSEIRGSITDMSEGGVSFITEQNQFALLSGTPLESIKIFRGQELIRETRGEIRNIKKIKANGRSQLRYGVQFGIGRISIDTAKLPEFEVSKETKVHKDTDAIRRGRRRHSDLSELAKRSPQVIHIENKKGEQMVGLLDTSLPLDSSSIPVLIVPPAFGKTKETLFSLAQTIVENFYLCGQPIAVIRFDGIRRKGESYKDPETSEPPYEMVNASLSQGASDIKALLDWLEDNPVLSADKVVLVSFSLAALEARLVLRDPSYRSKVDYWIACMGTPELRHLLTRVNCGLDLLEQYQLGIELGVRPVLGNLVNVDKYMEDGLANRIASLDQARDDIKQIDIPITWLYGEHDHWVKPEFIRDIMGIEAQAMREVIPISLGHNARTSKEALQMFGAITALVYRFIHQSKIKPVVPRKKNLFYKRHVEKDRVPSRNLKDRDEYWRRYLIGEQKLLGFDVLTLADDYSELMSDQVKALQLSPDDRVLDLGGGTGNFITHLLEANQSLPQDITIADLVPEALDKATDKLREKIQSLPRKIRFNTICCDVEMNRYLPILRFLKGEVATFMEFVDKIENISIQSASKIQKHYSPRLHRILRGERISPKIKKWLKQTFELPEYRTILDFNAASRYVLGMEREKPVYRKLVFSDDIKKGLHLPFRVGYFNKIVMSLVLSYIFNPLETLIETHRILSPRGFLILSSVRPDADASGLFTRLVKKVEQMEEDAFPEKWDKQLVLDSIRSFLNDAQALVELEEAGAFDFFDLDNLYGLLEEAGFEKVQTIETFGSPPQGYICVAAKGKDDERK